MSRKGEEKQDLRAVWESGTPLDSAWVDFADVFDRFAYQALHVYPDNDADVLDVNHPRYKELNMGWLPKSWEGRQAKLEIVTRNERANLLGKVYDGQLLALGCRTLKDGSDEVVRVPRQHFFVDYEYEENPYPDINWHKGELVAGQESYFDIRIVRPTDTIGTREMLDRETAGNSGKGGRPNTRIQIEKVAKDLLADETFRAKRRSDQAIEIRRTILGEAAAFRHDHPGYKTETITRILGRVDKSVDR